MIEETFIMQKRYIKPRKFRVFVCICIRFRFYFRFRTTRIRIPIVNYYNVNKFILTANKFEYRGEKKFYFYINYKTIEIIYKKHVKE